MIDRSGARPVPPATIRTSPPSRSTCIAPCGLDSRHRSPGFVSPTIAVLTMPPATERTWNSMAPLRSAGIDGLRHLQRRGHCGTWTVTYWPGWKYSALSNCNRTTETSRVTLMCSTTVPSR